MNNYYENYFNDLNLIDLISEKHKKLRQVVNLKFLEKGITNIFGLEPYLISILNVQKMTISESARKMNVSRQAVHKHSKNLIELGYIELESIEGNKRDKLLSLTSKGKQILDEMLDIKNEIENEIISEIGSENIEFIKKLLKKKWIK